MKKICILLCFLLIGYLAVAQNGSKITDEDSKRPNIVLILADDMGYSDIGSYGAEIQTPSIDKLADNGLRFTNFYNTARCSPSRASLLTGLYPHQAGVGRLVYRDFGGAYQGYLDEQTVTLAEVLGEAGYKTMMSGKWHVGHQKEEYWPINRGFDRFYGIHIHVDSYFKVLNCCSVYLDGEERIPPTDDPKNHLHPEKDWYTTDAFTDYSIHFLDEEVRASKKEKPFFLYVAYNAPHWPLEAPDEDIEKYRGEWMEGWDQLRKEKFRRMKDMGIIREHAELPDHNNPKWDTLSRQSKKELDFRRSIYAAQIDRMDQNIGRLVSHLKEIGEYKNTLFLFMSDNGSSGEPASQKFGYKWGENMMDNYSEWKEDSRRSSSQGMAWANLSNVPFRKYKVWTHEGGIATPLVVRWPGVIDGGGKIVRETGHLIDIMPTLLDVAEATYPESYNGNEIKPMQGKSLLPIFKGKDRKPHEYIFWEHESNKAVRKGDWKLVAEAGQNWELYDLEDDPTETNNVAGEHPDIFEDLRSAWEEWADDVGVRKWPIEEN